MSAEDSSDSADVDSEQIEQAVSNYTEDVQDEITEAVEAIMQTVNSAGGAADEALDVAAETRTILSGLAMGNMVVAGQGAMELLDDETGEEVDEAVAAIETVLQEAEQAVVESLDVAMMLVDGYTELNEDVVSLDIDLSSLDAFGDSIRDLFA